MIAAFIPARGGSKGLPRKNLRLLGGKPLFAWSIEAALSSNHITQIYVTTDDPEIAAVAKKYAVTVLNRPAALATDTAQNHDVVLDALKTIDPRPEIIVLLQPTSPLRNANDIDACIAALVNTPAQSATTVCENEHHPAKAMTLDHGMLQPFTNWKDAQARRQDLPVAYRQNGAVYAIRTQAFEREKHFLVSPVAAHIMPGERSIDIDTESDLADAQRLAS